MGHENQRFTVIPVDGNACEMTDPFTPSLCYAGLTWDESVELARLSFEQGFQVVIWKEGDQEEGGSGACVET